MKQCDYCKAELPDDARFCGNCGGVINVPADGQTRISNVQRADYYSFQVPVRPKVADRAPVIDAPSFPSHPQWNQVLEKSTVADTNKTPTLPLIEEDEERRRRAALLGMGLVGLAAYPQGSGAPMVQGTPQIGGVPSVQGAPQVPGNAIQAAPYTPPAQMPAPVNPTPHLPSTSSPTLTLHTPHPSSGSSGSPGSSGSQGSPPKHGCAPMLLIAAIIVPLIIIASIIGLGLTTFAPSLTLSGSSDVTTGGALTLHGSHFLPGGSISLTLDGTTPVFVSHKQPLHGTTDVAKAQQAQLLAHSLVSTAAQVYMAEASSNTISAGSDGAFNVTINVPATWAAGQHTIQASEAVTHRSASLSFTVISPFMTPTPSPSTTGSVTPTPTKTVTPTTTAPSTLQGLSCINPSSISLGPVSEHYAQAVKGAVMLCASGSGAVHWTANWTSSQAPWFALNTTSGQINAPGQVQISIEANAAQLGPGNYSTTITFSGSPGSNTETLSVSFAVKPGCMKASPGTLSFSGVANTSDAAGQTVGLTNCGATGTWTASATTTDGANWLYVSPSSNTIDNGAAPENVTITTSNLKTQLGSGNYSGSVTFAIGSGSFVVQVMLTVQPAPMLSVNPTSLTGRGDCSISNGMYACTVTLSNSSSAASLTWSYSQKLIPSLTVKAPSYSIAPGQNETVYLYISPNDCSSGATIIFTGPNNSANVAWQCYVPIG